MGESEEMVDVASAMALASNHIRVALPLNNLVRRSLGKDWAIQDFILVTLPFKQNSARALPILSLLVIGWRT